VGNLWLIPPKGKSLVAKVQPQEGPKAELADKPYITIEYTGQGKEGQTEEISYDYLVNATGPKLNFDATPGLGDGNGQIGSHTVSVCTADHAVHANEELKKSLKKLSLERNRRF